MISGMEAVKNDLSIWSFVFDLDMIVNGSARRGLQEDRVGMHRGV